MKPKEFLLTYKNKELSENKNSDINIYHKLDRDKDSDYRTVLIEKAAYDELKEALDKCYALTHQWVMAEKTVDCKHTYKQIRKVIDEINHSGN